MESIDQVKVNIMHAVSGGLLHQSNFLQSPCTSNDGPLTISIIYEARCAQKSLAIDHFTDFVFNFIMKQSASVDQQFSIIKKFKVDGFED